MAGILAGTGYTGQDTGFRLCDPGGPLRLCVNRVHFSARTNETHRVRAKAQRTAKIARLNPESPSLYPN